MSMVVSWQNTQLRRDAILVLAVIYFIVWAVSPSPNTFSAGLFLLVVGAAGTLLVVLAMRLQWFVTSVDPGTRCIVVTHRVLGFRLRRTIVPNQDIVHITNALPQPADLNASRKNYGTYVPVVLLLSNGRCRVVFQSPSGTKATAVALLLSDECRKPYIPSREVQAS